MSVDLTNEDNETSVSTDTLSQLTQDLEFLRKDFNESMIREIKKLHNSWRKFPLYNNIHILPLVI